MMNVMQCLNRAAALAIIALALNALGPAAQAQNKPAPGALAAATELVKLTGASALFEPLIAGVVEQAKNTYLQQDPTGLSRDLNEITVKMRADLAPRFSELSGAIANFYATSFTEQELKEILAFYKSPVGAKMIKQQPVVADNSMQFAQDWANKLSDEVMGKMRDELKKKGHPM